MDKLTLLTEVSILNDKIKQLEAKLEKRRRWPICENPEHLNFETDGTAYCQHCFYAVKAENRRLIELLDEIYESFTTEPYFVSTGRLQIATWIKSICERIKALKEE